jgi:uncharacterized protein (DUF885 family)
MKIITFILILVGFAFSQTNFHERINRLDSPENFENEEERLNALFELYGDFYKNQYPVQATQLGFEGYAGQWDKGSLANIRQITKELSEIKTALDTFDESKITGKTRTYFDLLEQDVSISLEYIDLEMFYFPVSQQGGSHLSFISTITNHPTSTRKDLENVLKLLEDVDIRVEELIEILDFGIEKGLVPPKVTMVNVPDQIRSVSESDAEENPFYSSFKKLDDSDEEIVAILNRAKRIIRDEVIPAYQKLFDFVTQKYLPACREEVGLSAIKDGIKKYNFLIRYFTTTETSTKQIHELGLSEVKRITAAMENIKEITGFKGNLAAFNNFLRTDPQFFYKEKEELLRGYRDICKRVDPELVKLFGKLPQLPYGVIQIPQYEEESATTAYYNSGSLSQGVPGYYYANTYKLETRPKWEMEALSLHEAVPGHHLQISLAQEINGQPDFMKFLRYTAFVEGWGLYSESLGPELGMYKDPYSKYGQLTYEMWRAIRLVVDTGIHAFGWSRDKAINYFMANSAKTENDITVEIDRYIAWPGQALAYKIGELKLKELRARSEKKLGEKFNIRAFHDLVLSEGSVPLSVLESMVNDWIKMQLQD